MYIMPYRKELVAYESTSSDTGTGAFCLCFHSSMIPLCYARVQPETEAERKDREQRRRERGALSNSVVFSLCTWAEKCCQQHQQQQ